MAISLTGGKFSYPSGVRVANGTLRLELSQDGVVTASSQQIAPKFIDIALDANGSIAAPPSIFGNDEISPSGTYYRATVFDSAGNRVFGPQFWSLTGGGTLDVGTIVPATTGVAYANAVIFSSVNGSVVLTGSANGTQGKQVSGGPEMLSFQNATANRVCIANFVGAEANARFLLDMQGNHEWGMGGGADQSVMFGISATGRMNLSGTSGGGLNIVRWTSPGVLEAQPRIGLDNDGSGIKFSDGTAVADARLGRSSAGILNFYGENGFGLLKEADSNHRVFIGADGDGIRLGSGSASPDVRLYRSSANVLALATGDSFLPESSGQTLGASGNQWRVYNQVVATGSLPAAGASMDGVILIEDAGAGDRNLIIYAGGQRFRIDGGAAF